MKYLLDTNICVFVIRRKLQLAVERFKQHPPDELGISTVTLAELRYGADKSSNPGKNHTALDSFLAPIDIVDFDAECVCSRLRRLAEKWPAAKRCSISWLITLVR